MSKYRGQRCPETQLEQHQRAGPRLNVQYHQGIGSGGIDEILRPTLMSVSSGSCFRLVSEGFGPSSSSNSSSSSVKDERIGTVDTHHHHHHHQHHQQHTHYQDDVYDEGNDPSLELDGLELAPSGRGYTLSLLVPPVFFKYVIGVKGITLSTIEKDTKCKLKIPKKGQEGSIVVTGETPSNVAHAKRRIEMVIWTNRFKEEPTHFISIPLTSLSTFEQLTAFKKEALEVQSDLPDPIFISPSRFHLTLGVLRVFSQEEEDKAAKLLQRCVTEAKAKLKSLPVVIALKGLDTMNDDHSAVRVIYSKVSLTDSSSRLQEFVDDIVTNFIAEAPELMRREFEREGVKLHATIINYRFLEDVTNAEFELHKGRRRHRPTGTLDATKLFRAFKNYDFGEVPLKSLHLSKRHEFDQNGYYKCIQEFNIE